ncbi:hypothetical protein FO519_008853 [Halicephalobus sp. NKZ332]|nr:hypothetical protein FO519_008853 [Halicephalobus sp. NKZ332]
MTFTNIDSSSSSSAESISVIEELQASTSSSPSSASSPVDPLPTNPSGKQALSCAICGGITSCRHFGAVSCNACAAFFRRTIAEKRTYSCSHHGNCTLISELVRRMCRHCRFKKCLQVGMQESEVLSLGSAGKQKSQTKDPKVKRESTDSLPYFSNGESETPTSEKKPVVIKFDHSGRYYAFEQNDIINRLKLSTDQIIYNRMKFSNMKELDSDCLSIMPQTSLRVLNEVQVFHTFLKSSGLADYIDVSEIYNNIVTLAQSWNVTQMIMNTLRLDGNARNRLHFIDHNYMPVTERAILEWYASDVVLRKDPYTITRISMPMWIRTQEIVRYLKEADFTPTEEAVFVTLTMVNFIINLCDNGSQMKHQLMPFVNQIFKSMKRYYTENLPSEDYGYRMGRLVMLLSLCTDLNKMMSEHREQIILLGKKMVIYTIKITE